MASRAAILRAAKAVPGAAVATPAPQGSVAGVYPSYGQLPQYSLQPGNPYGPGYGPFLPRDPRVFTSGAFAPFSPILPVPVDMPGPGLPRAQPRRWSPYPGYNLPVGQPGTEGYKLASFATLKALGESYSIMRTCIEIRKQEIRGLDWEVVLTPEAAKAYRGDRKAMRDFGERKAQATRFFRKPDPNYFDFASWLYAAMEQVFVYDALSLYMCPKKGRGLGRGLGGSDLDCLWLIDGSSVRPLMGLHGETPPPPAPAYQQYEFGVPRADLAGMVDGRDLDGADVGQLRALLRGDQFLYLPYVPRADSPYGFSLVEQAIVPIMTGLRKQAYQLDFFDESTVPRVYITAGKDMTPTQAREMMEGLNAVAGDMGQFFKVVVIPADSKVLPQKTMEIVDQADEWIATEVAMVASVNPMELGVLPKISTVASPFAAREMAQAQSTIHKRIATKPTLKYLTAIPDLILQVVFGWEDMRFLFSGMEEEQDLAAQNDVDIKDVQSGVKSIDEVRDSRGLVPWGLPETTGPIVITQAGPLPLEEAAGLARAQAAEARNPGGGRDAGDTGAHHAAVGAAGRKAIPAGVSGTGRMNGPVTQRQARRGGALAPAHATAEGTPGRSGGKSAAPVPLAAATAELEALARHVRKGRAVSTWQPRWLPESALTAIAGDLDRGIDVDQAASRAAAVIAKAASGTTQSQSRQRQLAAQLQALAQAQAAQVRAAFTSALTQAAALIAKWAAGALTITLAALVAEIAALVRKALVKALRRLWREAWALGREAAEDTAGGHIGGARDKEALSAFLAKYGDGVAGLISATRMRQLQEELTALIRAGEDPQAVMEAVEPILGVDWRAGLIAVTETTRAANAAALAVYTALGLAYKSWETRRDGRVCLRCKRNQDQGPVPIGAVFSSGEAHPGAHPGCRCWLTFYRPRPPQPTASKGTGDSRLTRRVGDNGQETWVESRTGPEVGGMGGPVPWPPRDDGTFWDPPDVEGGTSGPAPGGEPPRWDGTSPHPVVQGWVEGGDDASQGGPRGRGCPGTSWPGPYMDGYWDWDLGKWPQGGHGTGQAGMSAPGGDGPRGRAPNAVGKASGDAASFLASAPKAKAARVLAQLRENYPEASIAWVRGLDWRGPAEVPLRLVDWTGRKRWSASHEDAKVDEFKRALSAHGTVHPVVMAAEPGKRRYRVIDGHHRALACKALGIPVRAWLAEASGDALRAALEAHASQVHQGSDPANKSFTAGAGASPGAVSGLVPFSLAGQGGNTGAHRVMSHPGEPCPHDGPYVAGLMVRAADTGRVLMLQRAITEDDPAAGKLEPPGGHVDAGESLLQAALREWSEETGHRLPTNGHVTGSWDSADGIYRGFVLEVPSESVLDLGDGRDQVRNPDNPDGDVFEAILWMDPGEFKGNLSLRPEMQRDLPRVMAALNGATAEKRAKSGSAEVLREYWTGEGHPGPTMFALERKIRWGEPDDWYRCVDGVSPYLGAEGAKGYCNLRHHEVLGYWPAQHAQMEHGE